MYRNLFFVMLIVVMGAVSGGCKKAAAPAPPPLALEEIPGAMEKEFAKAKGQTKELAMGIVALVKEKKFTDASGQLRAICSIPELTEAQRSVATRSMLTVNENIQEAALTKGDVESAKSLEMQIRFK